MTNSRKSKSKTSCGIIDKIWSKHYELNFCFLCGVKFNRRISSEEHVFPKWLQEKYNLWNQRVVLLNNTKISYRYLKIPCCSNCNKKSLSKIENKIKRYSKRNFRLIKKIDKKILFYWLGKILYGILYKEMFLSSKRSDPKASSILSPEFLQRSKAHLLLLQGIRIKHEFDCFFPASLFFFETQLPAKVEEQWDFMDFYPGLGIAVRLGRTGIVAVMQDGGVQESFRNTLKDFYSVPLHPLQFREVSSLIFYRSSLFNRTPKFISSENGQKIKTFLIPLQGLSKKPLFDDWDTGDYAQVLSTYVGLPKEAINPSTNEVMSWISDENDKVIFMDIKKYPLPWV